MGFHVPVPRLPYLEFGIYQFMVFMYQSQRFRILMYHNALNFWFSYIYIYNSHILNFDIYIYILYTSYSSIRKIFQLPIRLAASFRETVARYLNSIRYPYVNLISKSRGSGGCCLFRLFRWGKLKHDLSLFFPGISFFHGTPFFWGGNKVDAQMYGSYEGFALDVLFRLVIFKM